MTSDEIWTTKRFGLFVTGRGEERFLPALFRSLAETGRCFFRVVRRVGQLRPRTAENRIQKMVGRGGKIPTIDEEFGISARRALDDGCDFIVLIDDLEGANFDEMKQIYSRYRTALDTFLRERKDCGAVHFLVRMLEAYFFADPNAIASTLKVQVTPAAVDVESIRHPKNDLKKLFNGYNEIDDAEQVVRRLDLPSVLSDSQTCQSLRSLFRWMSDKSGLDRTDRFRLNDGLVVDLTANQESPE